MLGGVGGGLNVGLQPMGRQRSRNQARSSFFVLFNLSDFCLVKMFKPNGPASTPEIRSCSVSPASCVTPGDQSLIQQKSTEFFTRLRFASNKSNLATLSVTFCSIQYPQDKKYLLNALNTIFFVSQLHRPGTEKRTRNPTYISYVRAKNVYPSVHAFLTQTCCQYEKQDVMSCCKLFITSKTEMRGENISVGEEPRPLGRQLHQIQ